MQSFSWLEEYFRFFCFINQFLKMFLLQRFLGGVRFRKYRPFSRPVKEKKIEKNDPIAILSTPKLLAAAPVLNSPFQAVRLLHAFHTKSVSEKISLALKLDVDLRRHSVRGVVTLPHGIKSDLKLLVFCNDSEVEEMLRAGADFAGISEPINKINKGWLGFDRCIATPALMAQVLKVAKILGPKKLMPNPKSGTVVENLKEAIAECKAGAQIEFRAESEGLVLIPIGLTSFTDSAVLDNIRFFVREILKHKPRDATIANAPKVSMIPQVNKLAKSLEKKQGDFFITEAYIQTESGVSVPIDTDRMHLGSTGYFR